MPRRHGITIRAGGRIVSQGPCGMSTLQAARSHADGDQSHADMSAIPGSRQTGSYPETGFNEVSRISNEKYASVYECFSSGRLTAYARIGFRPTVPTSAYEGSHSHHLVWETSFQLPLTQTSHSGYCPFVDNWPLHNEPTHWLHFDAQPVSPSPILPNIVSVVPHHDELLTAYLSGKVGLSRSETCARAYFSA